MEFPNEKLNRFNWTEKTPSPSVAVRYKVGEKDNNVPWKKYLVRELSKVVGGMDGLIRTDAGYANKIQLQEVA